MKRTLLLEPFSGVSGDMLNGMLLDLGADFKNLKKELAKLRLPEFKVTFQKKSKNSVVGGNFDVILSKDITKDSGMSDYYHNEHEKDYHHPHIHNSLDVRNLTDILEIINASSLSQYVKHHSCNVFKKIAKAESAVHNIDIREIHFHEVGATDSIVDIVSFFILVEDLQIRKTYITTLIDGSGFINVAHGMMPVPVPAVMQLRKNMNLPYIQDQTIHTELVTPTGLALIQELQPDTEIPDEFHILKIGYGFGKRTTGKFNALRGSLITLKHSADSINKIDDEIIKIEVNLDDQTPEELGYVFDLLIQKGALDVFWTSIYMKKNRPAILLTVLSKIKDEQKLITLILEQTNSFGVRTTRMQRYKMQRHIKEFSSKYGLFHVKIGQYNGITKKSLEFDDCARIAQEYNLPISRVYSYLSKMIKEGEEK